ncbi:MAG: hypothetical protein RLO18_28775, partial [Gimesia chilikensis]
MKQRLPLLTLCLLTLVSVLTQPGHELSAKDWPTYLMDRERAGATTDSVQTPLVPAWQYSAPSAPQTGQT